MDVTRAIVAIIANKGARALTINTQTRWSFFPHVGIMLHKRVCNTQLQYSYTSFRQSVIVKQARACFTQAASEQAPSVLDLGDGVHQ